MDRELLIGTIGDYATQGMAIGDVDLDDGARMTFRWVNPAFQQITGYHSAALMGRTAGILAGEAADPVVHLRIIRRMQAWETFTERLCLTRADGRSYWGELTFRPVGDGGLPEHWVLVIQDVTEQMAERAQISDLSLVAQTSTDMMCLLDTRLQITWCNRAFAGLKGRETAEIISAPVFAVLEAESFGSPTLEEAKDALQAGRQAECRFIAVGAEGHRLILEAVFLPIRDDVHGHTDGHLLTLRDISEQAAEECRFNTVFRQSDVAVGISDGETFLTANDAFAALCGRPVADILSRPLKTLADTPFLSEVSSFFASILRDGGERQFEQTLPAGEAGPLRHLQTRLFPGFDPLSRKPFVCVVANDVTRIREAEAELSHAQEEIRRSQDRLLSAIDASPEGIVLCDAEDRIVHVSRSFLDLHGPLAGQVSPGTSYADLARLGVTSGLWLIGSASPEAWLAAHLADRLAGRLQGQIIPMAGGRWMLCREVPLENGERISMRIDVTEIKADKDRLVFAQRAAEEAEGRLLAAIDALDHPLMIFDKDDRLVISNALGFSGAPDDVGFGLLGLSFEEILRSSVKNGVYADAIGRPDAFIAERLASHENPGEPKLSRLADGRVIQVVERKTRQRDTVVLQIDLTKEYRHREELERYAAELRASHTLLQQRNEALLAAQRALEHSSLHDPLTDLPNRRYLDILLDRHAKACREGRGFALLHVDLDRFKQVNDAFGHAVGDKVLIHTAEGLRRNLRDQDFVARVGGDEFVVLLANDDNVVALGDRAESIIRTLSKPVHVDGIECRIGASVGVARAAAGRAFMSPANLLVDADIALYEAKRQGRNRWVIFSPDLGARTLSRQRLSDALLEAIMDDRIDVHYQPQVRASDEALVGVEALLRWSDPVLGQIDPQTFLPIADEIGVTAELDRLMFHKIVQHDAAWRSEGILVPKISLNCTGRRLRSPKLVEDIRSSSIRPERLMVEVLETVFIDDEDRVLTWNIDQLRELGVSIALDDFGTGHSSIVGLLRLKPHALKIDRSFIDQALGVREAEILVASVIEIGKSLGLEVIAEGLETREQVEQLARMGCDTLQGYVFGSPMSAEQITGLFAGARSLAVPGA